MPAHPISANILKYSRPPDLSTLFRPPSPCVPGSGEEFEARGASTHTRQAAEAHPRTRSITRQRPHSPPKSAHFPTPNTSPESIGEPSHICWSRRDSKNAMCSRRTPPSHGRARWHPNRIFDVPAIAPHRSLRHTLQTTSTGAPDLD